MEDLTKHQLILLTLLISFVTSIATGVMTVSLLQEAPIEINRTINRVVEKTIEKVTPETGVLAPAKTKEVTTVVVKEEDLILSAINKSTQSIVRIREKDYMTGDTTIYGLGVVISADGTLIADRKTINAGNIYFGVFADGTELQLNPLGTEKKNTFILFKALIPEKSEKKYTFVPSIFAQKGPGLGQSVIALGGEVDNAVAVGRITNIVHKEETVASTTIRHISALEADIATKDIRSGSPLFDLSGEVVGIQVTNAPSRIFVPISVVREAITSLSEAEKKTN